MKVIMRTTVKVAPGKTAEYMEIDKKGEAIAIRAGGSPWKRYGCISGDSAHTLVYDMIALRHWKPFLRRCSQTQRGSSS